MLSTPLPEGCVDTALSPSCVERLLAAHAESLRVHFGVESFTVSIAKIPQYDWSLTGIREVDTWSRNEISRQRLLEEGVIERVDPKPDTTNENEAEEEGEAAKKRTIVRYHELPCVEYVLADGSQLDSAGLVEYLFYATGWRVRVMAVRPAGDESSSVRRNVHSTRMVCRRDGIGFARKHGIIDAIRDIHEMFVAVEKVHSLRVEGDALTLRCTWNYNPANIQAFYYLAMLAEALEVDSVAVIRDGLNGQGKEYTAEARFAVTDIQSDADTLRRHDYLALADELTYAKAVELYYDIVSDGFAVCPLNVEYHTYGEREGCYEASGAFYLGDLGFRDTVSIVYGHVDSTLRSSGDSSHADQGDSLKAIVRGEQGTPVVLPANGNTYTLGARSNPQEMRRVLDYFVKEEHPLAVRVSEEQRCLGGLSVTFEGDTVPICQGHRHAHTISGGTIGFCDSPPDTLCGEARELHFALPREVFGGDGTINLAFRLMEARIRCTTHRLSDRTYVPVAGAIAIGNMNVPAKPDGSVQMPIPIPPEPASTLAFTVEPWRRRYSMRCRDRRPESPIDVPADESSSVLQRENGAITQSARCSVSFTPEQSPDVTECLRKTVEVETRKLNRVHQSWLRREPSLAGKMKLAISVAPSGTVDSVALVKSTTGVSQFDTNILRYIQRWHLGQCGSSDGFELDYTVSFTPDD